MDQKQIEAEVERLALTAPRVKLEDIHALIKDSTYTMLPSGKVMVCEITLQNGFTVRGESSVVSKSNFNEELGKKISFDRAVNKAFEVEAYLLQESLYQEAKRLLSE